MLRKLKNKLSNYQIVVMWLLFIILLGAFLLSLPLSSRTNQWTSFIDSFFTATSAFCVTGLVVVDTYSYWSGFGQVVILILIQIGGIGFMTLFAVFAKAIGKKMSLHSRVIATENTGGSVAGNGKLLLRVAVGTIIVETLGAILLAIRFIPYFGWGKGIAFSFFHSISAYCNAGFDLMGSVEAFSSLTYFATDPLVNFVIITLIVVGGLGFLVWSDIFEKKANFRKLNLHSKIILVTTGLLIGLGALFFFVFERNNTLSGYNSWEQFIISLMGSVTPRTAGFNTINLTEMSEAGKLLTMILMVIGGGPASTAGGLKVTTFAVIVLSIRAQIRRKDSITLFKRKLDSKVYMQSMATLAIYLIGVLSATILICFLQNFDLRDVLFETLSATGTVGLSMGLTPQLNVASKLIISALMFGGKAGMLTLMLIFGIKKKTVALERPVEQIMIG